ncbi:AMP-binding protein [Streptomyces sp. LZ34]
MTNPAGKPAAEVAATRPRPAAGPAKSDEDQELSWEQRESLRRESTPGAGSAYLLSSADIRGSLDTGRLRAALERLTHEHAALRTVFQRPGRRAGAEVPRRRVLSVHSPVVISQRLPPEAGGDPVDTAHALIAPSASSLLRPFQRPPVVFVTSEVGPGHTVLSVLAHPALLDPWSLGPLWRELAAAYAGHGGPTTDRPATATATEERAPDTASAVRRRAETLAGWPQTMELPGDIRRGRERATDRARLRFGLSAEARAACDQARRRCGIPRDAVLLAAWSLVVGRRAGVSRLLMGLYTAGRTTQGPGASRALGAAGRLLVVGSELADDRSVADCLTATAQEMGRALDCADAPFHELAEALGALGDPSRPPVVQVAFDAHDELMPTTLVADGITMDIREGPRSDLAHDAVLSVLRWGETPLLALDYAPSVVRGDEAAELAHAVDRTLVELAAELDAPSADAGRVPLLGHVRTFTAEQRERLLSDGHAPVSGPRGPLDVWRLFEEVAHARPTAVAVRDADPAQCHTYRELLTAAEEQSATLAAAGVTAGDRVALAVRRSARELVAVLAVLRLGAAYTSLEPTMPPRPAARLLDSAGVRVVLGDERRLTALGDALEGRVALAMSGDKRPRPAAGSRAPARAERRVPPAAVVDGTAAAYLPPVLGATGAPRAVPVPRSEIVRLAHAPEYLRPGAADRFLRLAPLASDVSALEIFAPLLAGGTVEVFPVGPADPDPLAAFLRARRVTGMWLDAGKFRQVADYRPGAFAPTTQVLVGRDVVPPAQVARVLRSCPGLRVTHTYGPVEYGALTAVLHLDDPAELIDPLPIGRPVAGTGALVLDAGGRLAPPGAVGELHVYGHADPAPRPGPGAGRVPHPTGDLARWDSAGRLRLVRRRPGEVTVRGAGVDLVGVAHALREHPDVRDAVVLKTGGGELLAGVVIRDDPSLAEVLRVHASERLPSEAVPSLWVLIGEAGAIPLGPDGTPDEGVLARLATAGDVVGRRAAKARTEVTAAPLDAPLPPADTTANGTARDAAQGPADQAPDVETIVRSAWQDALDGAEFGRDDVFFDVGGTSVHMLRLRASLHKRLPDHGITVQDLYHHPTIAELAAHLRRGPST